jgi:hypothetical protein
MWIEIVSLILSILSFIALVIYAYFTYLIAKDSYDPFVSFSLIPFIKSHINFSIVNKSKIEVEVFGKMWLNFNKEYFDFKRGFYGNGYSWILQPFTEGDGHFDLMDMTNKEGIKLIDFISVNKVSSANVFFQIKYHKVGSKKWKKSSPQKFFYDFEKNLFWLNV